MVRLDGVSLSTATIPIVNDVRGEIRFDNLWELTTPPGQQVTIGELNPGVSVTNGRVNFQLLSDERVAIERAEFDFASGTLAMRRRRLRSAPMKRALNSHCATSMPTALVAHAERA
jgi:translocation and assembly module TamB